MCYNTGMKKLLPIYILMTSIIILAMAVISLICMIATVYAAPAEIVAIPMSIVSLVLSAVTMPFAVLFKRDNLCFVSIFISAAALLLSVVAVVIWQAAL